MRRQYCITDALMTKVALLKARSTFLPDSVCFSKKVTLFSEIDFDKKATYN